MQIFATELVIHPSEPFLVPEVESPEKSEHCSTDHNVVHMRNHEVCVVKVDVHGKCAEVNRPVRPPIVKEEYE